MSAKEDFLKALQAYLAEEGWLENGWALGDWIVIAEATPFAEEAAGMTKYMHVLPGESVPWHRILGLLKVAQVELDDQMRDSG